jgi:hypothetical protein
MRQEETLNVEAIGENFYLYSNQRFLSVNRAGDILYDRSYRVPRRERRSWIHTAMEVMEVGVGVIEVGANALRVYGCVVSACSNFEPIHLDLDDPSYPREFYVDLAEHQAN